MTDRKDIVERLRLTPVLMHADAFGQSKIDYEACKKYLNDEGVKLMREAANEIERLRAEASDLRGWKGDALHTYQVCAMERDRLRVERDEARKDRSAYRIEIDRLIGQREEARRLAIHHQVQVQRLSGPNHLKESEWQACRRIAAERGWYCFEEDSHD